MADYPVQVDVVSPPRFDRVQLLLRILLAIVLGWLGVTAGWLVAVLYATLPIVAAIAISSEGSDAFTRKVAPALWRVIAWLLEFSGYMSMLVDRFPTYEDHAVKPSIRFGGHPTAGSALSRLITSLPSGLVLAVLWFVSSILWVIAAVFVLVGAPMPPAILAYQRGMLRWQARLVAYHASLIDEYPPWSFDTDVPAAPIASAGAR
ncbi:MAG TPA: DUF4389 domain-containing protein [Kofleriaceae bacterium]|nr:DUF4389 domain-containing protein [Kofleriaceae bacterium]